MPDGESQPRWGKCMAIAKFGLRRRRKLPSLGLLISLACLFASIMSLVSLWKVRREAVKAHGGIIKIKLQEIRPGQAQSFVYNDRAGAKLRFILARDQNGSAHAAFDACERCYPYRRGFAVKDGEIVCRYCGNSYTIRDMEHGMASCVPVALKLNVSGQSATIRVSDLEAGRWLF